MKYRIFIVLTAFLHWGDTKIFALGASHYGTASNWTNFLKPAV